MSATAKLSYVVQMYQALGMHISPCKMHALLNSPCKMYVLLNSPCKMYVLLNSPYKMYALLKSECTEKSSKIGKSWPQLKT